MTALLTKSVLDTIRQRRSAGETLSRLAGEIGIPWQRLWSLLYSAPHAADDSVDTSPVLRKVTVDGPLVERYRPITLDAIFGQAKVVKVLRKFASQPYSTAFVFEGETGTGKTSAALALAAALGCDLDQKEFGGVQTIASGEQSADAVREAYQHMHVAPWSGSGWKVVIVNEADRLARTAEVIWLDVLESLPAKTVIVFTTNEAARLSQRFLDRCTRLTFESDAVKLRASANQFATAVWTEETGKKPHATKIQKIVESTQADGRISFRRLVQTLAVEINTENDF